MRPLTQRQLGWLEAFIDLRGSFQFILSPPTKKRGLPAYNLKIQFYDLGTKLSKRFESITGLSLPYSPNRGFHHLSHNALRELLPIIHCIEKKEHQQILIKTLAILDNRRWKPYSRTEQDDKKLELLATEMKALNFIERKPVPEAKRNYKRTQELKNTEMTL